jgi:hypothetical protein
MDYNGSPETSPEPVFQPTPLPTKDDLRKHGMYYYALNDHERVLYELALENRGLTHEMALLQAKIEYFALVYPLDLRLIIRAVNALKGLMKVHYSIFEKDKGVDVVQKIAEFVQSIGMPQDELKAAWDHAHRTS